MQLRTHLVVHHPTTRQPVFLAPGEDVPDWAVPLISMPGVWASDPDPDTAESPAAPTVNDRLALMTGASDRMTRDELLHIASTMGLVSGEDYSPTASKQVILAAIRHKADQLRGGAS